MPGVRVPAIQYLPFTPPQTAILLQLNDLYTLQSLKMAKKGIQSLCRVQ